MNTVLTTEPSAVTAGDTIQWSKSLPDYPASAGWVLSYVLVGAAGKITITGTASGDNHSIAVTAATSAEWSAGPYVWQAYVTKGAERYTIGSGLIEVAANLAAIAGATRSHAKKVLDAIEATLEGTATTDQQELTIDGTTLKRKSIADLIKLRQLYKQEYQSELAAERIKQGLGSGNKVLVRFR